LGDGVVEESAFQPRADGLPPVAVRKILFPTWLSLPGPLADNRNARSALTKAVGTIDDPTVQQVEEWFESTRDRILRDCAWYRMLQHQFEVHHAAIPTIQDRTSALLAMVRSLGASRVDPQADREAAERIALETLLAATSRQSDSANTAAIRAELGRNMSRYQAQLDRSWAAESINVSLTPGDQVARLLDSIVAGLTHSSRRGVFGIVRDEPEGSSARESWNALLFSSAGLNGYRSPHQLWLTSESSVVKPALIADAANHARLDQPIAARISQLLRPDPLHCGADQALERAITSSALPFGLADPRSRAALLLAYRSRWGLETIIPEGALDPAQLAVRSAFAKSGALSLALRESPRAEKIMSFLTDPGRLAAGVWLQRVWGNLWRRELNGDPVENLDEAWQVVVGVAYSFGQALKPKIAHRGGPPSGDPPGDAPQSGPPVASDVQNAIIEVFAAWEDDEKKRAFVLRIRDYSHTEADSIMTGKPGPLPETLSVDRAQWKKAVESCVGAYPGAGGEFIRQHASFSAMTSFVRGYA